MNLKQTWCVNNPLAYILSAVLACIRLPENWSGVQVRACKILHVSNTKAHTAIVWKNILSSSYAFHLDYWRANNIFESWATRFSCCSMPGSWTSLLEGAWGGLFWKVAQVQHLFHKTPGTPLTPEGEGKLSAATINWKRVSVHPINKIK